MTNGKTSMWVSSNDNITIKLITDKGTLKPT